MRRMLLLASIVASATAAASIEPAAAQCMQQGMGSSTMHGDMSGMMCPMMQSAMRHEGRMGSGMMGSGMMGMGGEAGGLFGSHVTPVMNLSVEDVRAYLSSQLERLNNKRLKLGDINSADGMISADVVTVDNSLVQRLKVDRHSGAITYED